MTPPFFSIIVPVYKVERYINECIDSILNQDFKDFELILVDDGSPDACPDICDEYAKTDNRIKVIHKSNEGLVNARKSGSEICKGQYVINVDSDDYIANGALKVIADICMTTSADVVCYGIRRFGLFNQIVNNTFEEGLYNTPELLSRIYSKFIYDSDKPFYSFGIHPSLCSKVIKQELYVNYQLLADSRVSIGEDFLVTLPIILNSKSIYITDKILYYYRSYSSSMVNTYDKAEFEELMHMVDYIKQYINFKDDIFEPQLDAYIYYRLNTVFSRECMVNDSCFRAIKTIKAYYSQIKDKLLKSKCSKHVDLKYKIIKFVIDNHIWIYFWINAYRIKFKQRHKIN